MSRSRKTRKGQGKGFTAKGWAGYEIISKKFIIKEDRRKNYLLNQGMTD